jgi:hypothetical protein
VLLCFALAVLASPFKSRSRLEVGNAVLRHQLIVLRRKVQGRVRLTNNDRWFLVQLYRKARPLMTQSGRGSVIKRDRRGQRSGVKVPSPSSFAI